ncbi:hypothetical protein [Anaerorhabdus furcosa]|uniref:Uncharacterized protein n=1 Tax=Anaerorhabdus furcosa TaxID=118967 RepID=A0A1T4P818_9FIRM|nr:hypothetical protein [Anaerorhabdus furcosa]SJZ87589.1 hypothetical protein SAMN02745191_1922 [Anaerorhabdus furcosa]
MYNKRGNTTVDLMIGLLAATMLIPIIYTSFRLLTTHQYFNDEAQDEIALNQLRRTTFLMESKEVINGILIGQYSQENVEFITKNNHLYMTPGTLIFFTNLDEGYFIKENGLIYYEYLRKGTVRKRVITNE